MRQNFSLSLLAIAALFSIYSCSKEPVADPDPVVDPTPEQPVDSTPSDFEADIEYVYDDSDFLNPERGMYITLGYNYYEDTDECTAALSVEQMRKRVRDAHMTLTFSEYYIHGTFDKEYSETFLKTVREDLNNHRAAGIKTIVRFVYIYKGPEVNPKPVNPTPEMTLKHVAQLKPIFQEYSDVIYVLQAGFIGACAEWCADVPAFKKAEKKALIDALLDALPETRQIELRTPDFKISLFGLKKADTLTIEKAFTADPLARIGGHNDCFLANGNDAGTYADGLSRKFWKCDTRYTIMGGETCMVNETYCKCDYTYENLIDYHWSYLNSTYNTDVLKMLDGEGCFTDIKKRLGYRLSLDKAAFDGRWMAGEPMTIHLSVTNTGFACLMNPRLVEFIIERADGKGEASVIRTDIDPRFWPAGETTFVEHRINLPENLERGVKYNLYLNLPDPEKTLYGNPEFSVRLANKSMWNAGTGYNLIYNFTAE